MNRTRLAPKSAEQAHRRRVGVAVAALAAAVLLVVVLRPGDDVGSAKGDSSAEPTAPATSASTKGASSPPSPAPEATTPTPTLPDYRTTGRFRTAPGTSEIRGTGGRLIRYEIRVEEGSGIRSAAFAAAVDATLRHPRGWTAGGHWRFQRIAKGDPDLIIWLATPDTVDKRCGAAGADTDGYTSCRAGRDILLNLDRWYVGVPHVKDLDLYRNYLVNHEVGHGLGEGHQACPGKGRTAPVMLQQTLGLDGCTANAWPRSPSGKPITGPPRR